MDRRDFLRATAFPAAMALDATRPPYGARGDGRTDDSRAIQAAIEAAGGGTVYLPPGTYLCERVAIARANLVGAGMLATTLRAVGRAPILELGYAEPHWAYRGISGMTLDGAGRAVGASLRSASHGELPGRWAFERVQFLDCARGIEKPAGNIGNAFTHCLFRGCDFGYHAVGNESPAMHAGNDTFDMCHLEGCRSAAIFVDCTVPAGGALKLRETIVEGNPGFGVQVANFRGQYAPLVLDNVWFEANAKADLHLRNVARANILGGRIERLELVNSHALVQGAYLVYPDRIAADAASTLAHDSPHLDYGALAAGMVRHAPLGPLAAAGPDAPVWRMQPRQETNAAEEITLAAGEALRIAGTRSEFAADRCLAWVIEAKLVRGDSRSLSIRLHGASPLSAEAGPLVGAAWCAIVGMCATRSAGACELRVGNRGSEAAVVSLGGFRLAQFERVQDAVECIDSGLLARTIRSV